VTKFGGQKQKDCFTEAVLLLSSYCKTGQTKNYTLLTLKWVFFLSRKLEINHSKLSIQETQDTRKHSNCLDGCHLE